ncbi:MAG: TonB-dependent receptor [bacterium]|nr:TonB-dependent receptor [bacterium]
MKACRQTARLILVLILLVFPLSGRAQEGEESFLDAGEWVQVEMLQKKLEEVPLAVSVITDGEIRESGATNIPDLLRRLPGMDVMQTTAAGSDVCSRGFNRTWSNKMLVLVDGRTVYQDVMGMVWWEALDISLEEIKRIEVIRSSGSALYGANAFSGVINIITKSPRELTGTRLNATYGERGTLIGSVIQGGKIGQLSYKASAGWNQAYKWRDSDDPSLQVGKGRAFFSYPLFHDSEVSVEGGGVYGRNMEIFYDVLGYMMVKNASQPHLKLAYRSPHLRVGAFWTGGQGDIDIRLKDMPLLSTALGGYFSLVPEELADATMTIKDFDLDTYDFDFRHNFELAYLGKISWGGGYRLNTVKINPPGTINEQWQFSVNKFMDKSYRAIHIGSAYINDEKGILRNLSLLAGIRFDEHSEFGFNFSPQGSLVFTPVLNHTLYFSSGYTYRNPTHFEAFLDVPVEVLGFQLTVIGNKDLKPEKIISTELGYRWLPSPDAIVNANIFSSWGYDLIHAPPSGSPGEMFEKPYVMWENFGKIWLLGGEIEAKGKLRSWLSGFANCSFQYLENLKDDPATAQVDEAGTRVKTAPLYKLNAGFTLKPGFDLYFTVSDSFVSKTDWSSLSGFYPIGSAPAYNLVNAQLGRSFWKKNADISIAAFNLLNYEHREFPLAEKIGRKITGTVRVNF